MRYTVTWTESADRELGEVWLSSTNRIGVSSASIEIDRLLKDDAHLKGNEVAEGLRGVNVPPLRFLFTASQADRIDKIAHFLTTPR